LTVPIDDGNCFACGPENPIGLHLRFERDGEGVRADTVLAQPFQGWQSIAHGGIAMALLDEAMAHAAGAAGHRGMTASVNVRFRKPVPIGKPITIAGRVTWQRRNVLGVEAVVRDESGTVLLDGEGKFVSKGAVDAVNDYRIGPYSAATRTRGPSTGSG
jgi:acyl-coenzyme A thioesterase PaaI-like protein